MLCKNIHKHVKTTLYNICYVFLFILTHVLYVFAITWLWHTASLHCGGHGVDLPFGADAYRKLHRKTGSSKFRSRMYWHTWVRHSRKKDKETGEWLPIQFACRKRIIKRDGSVDWRLGGTQKKDGFFAGLRKHVSRRAFATTDRNTVREMCYFYQWVYWRTADAEMDALRGCHDRSQPPTYTLQSACHGEAYEAFHS